MSSSVSPNGFEKDSPGGHLDQGACRLGVALDPPQIQAMLDHLDLLVHWNRRLNLTAITTPSRMLVEHLLDSLSVVPHLSGNRVLDIGSGGGFPGIPLAVASGHRSFSLLDSRGKRVEFLRHVVGRLDLVNAIPIKARIQDYKPRQPFDTLVCRAFAPLPDILEWSAHLLGPGAVLIAMKGKVPTDELALCDNRFNLDVIPVDVPGLRAERHLIKVEMG